MGSNAVSLTDDFFYGTKLYHKKFTDFCRPIAKHLGITHAIYVNIDKHGQVFTVCTEPKWVERFLEEQYYKVDPFFVHPDNIHNGFSFDSSVLDRDFQDTLLYDATVKFNWCHSFAYIEKTDNGGYFGFDFGTTKDNYKIFDRLINDMPIVKKHIRNLNSKLTLAAANDLLEKKVDLAALKGDLFHSQRGLVYNEAVDYKNKAELVMALDFLPEITGLLL